MTIYHKHHIVPKHMGGTDDPSNLVELTIEEHAQAHLDLYNKYGHEQDIVAHRMLLGQIDKAEAIKTLQKAPKSIAWKKKLSERLKGNTYGKNRAGIPMTEEGKKNISKAKKGKPNLKKRGIPHTEETKQKMRDAMTGRKLSDETKKKIAESLRGRKRGKYKH